MESAAASYIGMGLAAAGMAGSGLGLGFLFGKAIEAIARQPGAESQLTKYMWIGAAFVEAVALYGMVLAFIMMP
ncbi:ATP synthase F0 subunit C [Magnetofaba australis]|uniref:ATP synthase subunit c n=1 Tax=Magnetofaba australis IT-1 TaxID=1434232 RepID=A0A1Y2K815_9PROT|nr:ATP synthase F0 subunit C [Magnetofaba australis]OSM06203.1 putative ATP synthase F0 subunit chi [Magnetofaba australis IT-1]